MMSTAWVKGRKGTIISIVILVAFAALTAVFGL